MNSLPLTLDGTLDDWCIRPGAMRWVPPERAAAIRQDRRPVQANTTDAEPLGDEATLVADAGTSGTAKTTTS